jgi:glutathione S-transferase
MARARKDVSYVLSLLDRELSLRADRGYLAGYTYTLADVCFMPSFQFLEEAGEQGLISAHAHVHSWWTRVSARPTFRKALQKRAERRLKLTASNSREPARALSALSG